MYLMACRLSKREKEIQLSQASYRTLRRSLKNAINQAITVIWPICRMMFGYQSAAPRLSVPNSPRACNTGGYKYKTHILPGRLQIVTRDLPIKRRHPGSGGPRKGDAVHGCRQTTMII